jgi:hypothetical protein
MRLAWVWTLVAVLGLTLVLSTLFGGPAVRAANRESFGAGLPLDNSVLNPVGASVIDTACQALTSDGSQYVMHGIPYLKKHPTEPNTCVFVRNAEDNAIMTASRATGCAPGHECLFADNDKEANTVVDASLSACTSSGFLGDEGAGVVASVQPSEGYCVVTLNHGLGRDRYEQYEQGARTRTLQRTPPYLALDAAYQKVLLQLAWLTKEIADLTTNLVPKAEMIRTGLRSEHSKLTKAIEIAEADFAANTAQLATLVKQTQDASAFADVLDGRSTPLEGQVTTLKGENESTDKAIGNAKHAALAASGEQTLLQGQLRDKQKELQGAWDTLTDITGKTNTKLTEAGLTTDSPTPFASGSFMASCQGCQMTPAGYFMLNCICKSVDGSLVSNPKVRLSDCGGKDVANANGMLTC